MKEHAESPTLRFIPPNCRAEKFTAMNQKMTNLFLEYLPISNFLSSHFDDYSLGKGNDKNNRGGQLDVKSPGENTFEWLDGEINFDVALKAASDLFEAIKDIELPRN